MVGQPTDNETGQPAMGHNTRENYVLRGANSGEGNYTQIRNQALQDGRLSMTEVGALAFMLSHPKDWIFHVTVLASHFDVSPRTINRALSRLEELGYVWSIQEKDRETGRVLGMRYYVTDHPELYEQIRTLAKERDVRTTRQMRRAAETLNKTTGSKKTSQTTNTSRGPHDKNPRPGQCRRYKDNINLQRKQRGRENVNGTTRATSTESPNDLKGDGCATGRRQPGGHSNDSVRDSSVWSGGNGTANIHSKDVTVGEFGQVTISTQFRNNLQERYSEDQINRALQRVKLSRPSDTATCMPEVRRQCSFVKEDDENRLKRESTNARNNNSL